MKYNMKRVYRAGWLTRAEECMAVCAVCAAAGAVILLAWTGWYCWEAVIWRICGQ